MVVCRYYLQGICRFGDRCRFEHPEPDDSFNKYEYQNRQSYDTQNQAIPRQQRSSRYDQHFNQTQNFESFNRYGQNQRYNSPNRYDTNQRYVSPDRYVQRYSSPTFVQNERYNSPDKYSSNNYDHSRRHDTDRYGLQSTQAYRSWNNQNYAADKTNEEVPYRRQNNLSNDGSYIAGRQNNYRWVSDDYKKKLETTKQFSSEKESGYQYSSTPKSGVSFSFKVPDSELKRTVISETDPIYAEMLKEDATAWELGKSWPFSCYFPFPDKPGFPGFTDISPEELRYEAYKAKENNSFDSYVQTVANAIHNIKLKRDALKVPSLQLFDVLRKIKKGEDLCADTSNAFSSVLNNANSTESMIAESIPPASNTSVISSFSFKMPTEVDSSSKMSASNFNLPSDMSTIHVSSPQEIESTIYTLLEKLTDEEKEQFSASTFTLGKIPTNP
ncbi:Nucleoporin-like protein 2, partial [Stegodyphus mimosarum]